VEVLDEGTLAAIRRLVEAGVLRFAGPAPEVLHREAGMADDAAAERAKRLAAIAPLAAEAERRLRMGRLLLANGFAAEAVSPLATAYETVLKAAATVALGEAAAERPVTDDVVETALAPRGLVPTGALPALARLRAGDRPDESVIPGLYGAVEAVLAALRA
jgi:hypothetical protein